MTSNAKAEGRYSKDDFIYVARDDEYQCPAEQRLRRHHTSVENGQRIQVYWTAVCPQCPLKAQCTTGNERECGAGNMKRCSKRYSGGWTSSPTQCF